jgi:hypothetical protein
MPNYQGVWSLSEQYQNASGWPSPPGFVATTGGYTGSVRIATIQLFTTTTSNNATDFGDLSEGRIGVASYGNSTRALAAGGFNDSLSRVNTIEFVTFAAGGNATDFGDLSGAYLEMGSAGNQTRGIFAGGQDAARTNVIEYVTVASASNTTDFGDLTRCIGIALGG